MLETQLRKKEQVILYSVFTFYAVILWYVLIDRGLLFDLLTGGISFQDIAVHNRCFSLRPFLMIRSQYHCYGIQGIFNKDVFGNVIMFIPVGIFTCTFTKGKNPYRFIFVIPLISVIIEIVQFVLATGTLDIDDVFLNTLGGIVGICLFTVIYRFLHKDMPAVKRFVAVASSLFPPYLLMFFYKLFMNLGRRQFKWYDFIFVIAYYLFLLFAFKEYSKKQKIIISALYAAFCIVFFAFVIYL